MKFGTEEPHLKSQFEFQFGLYQFSMALTSHES
jgi:hypothetical protein